MPGADLPPEVEAELRVLHDHLPGRHTREHCASYACFHMDGLRAAARIGRASLHPAAHMGVPGATFDDVWSDAGPPPAVDVHLISWTKFGRVPASMDDLVPGARVMVRVNGEPRGATVKAVSDGRIYLDVDGGLASGEVSIKLVPVKGE